MGSLSHKQISDAYKRIRINPREKNIPSDMYSLLKGGFPRESYCLVKNLTNWEVYYSKRGTKQGVRIFETEDEACEYLLKKLEQFAQ